MIRVGSDVVHRDMNIDVLGHRNVDNLLDSHRVLDDVVYVLLDNIVDVDRLFDDVLDWSFDNLLYENFYRNSSFDDVLDVVRTFD
jgi:hypothetical protein